MDNSNLIPHSTCYFETSIWVHIQCVCVTSLLLSVLCFYALSGAVHVCSSVSGVLAEWRIITEVRKVHIKIST